MKLCFAPSIITQKTIQNLKILESLSIPSYKFIYNLNHLDTLKYLNISGQCCIENDGISNLTSLQCLYMIRNKSITNINKLESLKILNYELSYLHYNGFKEIKNLKYVKPFDKQEIGTNYPINVNLPNSPTHYIESRTILNSKNEQYNVKYTCLLNYLNKVNEYYNKTKIDDITKFTLEIDTCIYGFNKFPKGLLDMETEILQCYSEYELSWFMNHENNGFFIKFINDALELFGYYLEERVCIFQSHTETHKYTVKCFPWLN